MTTAAFRRVWQAGWVAAAVAILLATTWPWSDFQGHVHWGKVEWLPFMHRVAPRFVLLNVLLFVPYGLAGRRAWPHLPLRFWVLTGCALSLMVETYQLFSHNRLPSSIDVITNTLGATIGAASAGAASGTVAHSAQAPGRPDPVDETS